MKQHTDPLHNPWSGGDLSVGSDLSTCNVQLSPGEEYEDKTPLGSGALVSDPLHGREQEVKTCSKK